jgi:hypothetical protein
MPLAETSRRNAKPNADGKRRSAAVIFDRGVALVQLDFPAERIRRVLQNGTWRRPTRSQLSLRREGRRAQLISGTVRPRLGAKRPPVVQGCRPRRTLGKNSKKSLPERSPPIKDGNVRLHGNVISSAAFVSEAWREAANILLLCKLSNESLSTT